MFRVFRACNLFPALAFASGPCLGDKEPMPPPPANVTIHPSQYPDSVRRDLIESLRTRAVNHKFHYDTVKQTQKWLELHQAYSPSRTDADCAATYDRAFRAVADAITVRGVDLIGLGCGGGQKDSRLLALLKSRGLEASYTPVDVSLAMVLVARQEALSALPAERCHPMVCDLATADNLSEFFAVREETAGARLITFFGMIPNFEPPVILPKLAGLVRPGDSLLFSANLAPGPDYSAGVRRILPLYDNALTRDWLMIFLCDLGVELVDGELRFSIASDPVNGLQRVEANFHFITRREVDVDADVFVFEPGESIRLFFSYRHTPERVRQLLARCGLVVREQWITQSEEEGVFLVRRS